MCAEAKRHLWGVFFSATDKIAAASLEILAAECKAMQYKEEAD